MFYVCQHQLQIYYHGMDVLTFFRKNISRKNGKDNHKAHETVFTHDVFYDDFHPLHRAVSLKQKHLRLLATKGYKSTNDMNHKFMKTYFNFKNIIHNLRNGPSLSLPASKLTYFGLYSALFK